VLQPLKLKMPLWKLTITAFIAAILINVGSGGAQVRHWTRYKISDSIQIQKIQSIDSLTGYAFGKISPNGSIAIFRTDDGGIDWKRLPFGMYSSYSSEFYIIDSLLYVSVQIPDRIRLYRHLVSLDKGQTWKIIDTLPNKYYFWSSTSGLRINGFSRAIETTRDIGETWKAVPYNYDLDTMLRHANFGWIVVDSLNWLIPFFPYYYDSFLKDFADTGSITNLRTTDGGLTWHRDEYPMSGWTFRWSVKLNTEGEWWTLLTKSTAPLQYSTDSGRSWQATVLPPIYAYGNFSGFFAYQMTSADSMVCMATDTLEKRFTFAVWYSADRGSHWTREASFDNDNLSDMYFLDSKHGWISAVDSNFSSYVYIYRSQGVASADLIEPVETAAAVYPNPATTAITVTDEALMPIDVYDALGRTVAISHTEAVNGSRTLNIESLPPGCYTLKLGSRKFVRFMKN
jgi:photosystem II stability/assembly factor-like uncharacterized protein